MWPQFRVELRLLAETLRHCLAIPEQWGQNGLALIARLALYIYDMIVISTVIQVGLALPMAIYFHRISFSGLSANVIIVPLLTAVVPIGFLAVFTDWRFPAVVAEFLLRLSRTSCPLACAVGTRCTCPRSSAMANAGFCGCATAACLYFDPLMALAAAGVGRRAGPVCRSVRLPVPAPMTDPGQLELTAIDVGQGDGLLVAFPDGKLMMVDGGGFPNLFGRKVKPKLDIGEDVISPYLWSRSVKKLDVVVCTHAHEDHTGGLGAIIDNFHPAQLWTGANGESPVWRDAPRQGLGEACPDRFYARWTQLRFRRCAH